MKSNRDNFEKDTTMFEEDVKKEVVTEAKKEPVMPKKYIITVNNLALRIGPGKDFEKLGLAEAGITSITEIKNGYGKLADGSGWVSMAYVRKAD